VQKIDNTRNQEAMITVEICRISPETDADLPLPSYESSGAAGADLCSSKEYTLQPGQRVLIQTGLAISLPEGYEGQIRPRSGLAFRHGVTVLNAPGTIDEDFRGELCVLLINHGEKPFEIKRKDRIAQLVIAPVVRASWREVTQLQSTQRGAGGFGSTGLSKKNG
jgi:dUTP pyrophosphatase